VVRIAEVGVSCSRRPELTDAFTIRRIIDADRVAKRIGHYKLTTTVDRYAIRPTELTLADVGDSLTIQRHYLNSLSLAVSYSDMSLTSQGDTKRLNLTLRQHTDSFTIDIEDAELVIAWSRHVVLGDNQTFVMLKE
jgi:hypothetical protein